MHIPRLTSIAALAVGATLLAVPAFADSATPGNKGETGTNRAAPATLPGTITPQPVPQVDSSALSRGIFGGDEAAAVAGMATVTLSHDGSVSEQAASAGMRDLIASAIKGKDASTSDATPRVVPGPDNRTQITDSSAYPFGAIGWLWTQDQKGNWATCTATLIGPKSVITAAHCVYDHDTGGWVKSMLFIPGATDAQTAPYGQYDWANVNILKGFIDNYDGKNYGSVMPWDIAEVELQTDAGNQIGWMGFQVDDGSAWTATTAGYPGDKPDGTMWQTTCDIPANTTQDPTVAHTCATYAGTSGSPMWAADAKGDLYIRALNVAEDVQGKMNYGVRLTDAYYQFLTDNYK